MDLSYSDEQIALRESIEKFLRERYSPETRREPGRAWQTFAEMGWLGAAIQEAYGGLGGGMVEVAILSEAMGKYLVAEPYIESIPFASTALTACASVEQKQRLLPRLADGRLRLAHAVLRDAEVSTQGKDVRLSGRSGLVRDATLAEAFLVFSSGTSGRAINLSLVDAKAPGLLMNPVPTVDGRIAARLTMDGVLAERIGSPEDAAPAFGYARDCASAASCNDMVGAMNAVTEATVAYAKMRVQFGQPIASNQVIKHRLVEMAIKGEEARSCALRATIACLEGRDDHERARAVSGAKIKIALASKNVMEEAIQIHGGMGVTDELDIGAYLKRQIAFSTTYGTVAEHRSAYEAARRSVTKAHA